MKMRVIVEVETALSKFDFNELVQKFIDNSVLWSSSGIELKFVGTEMIDKKSELFPN